jgi:hypothetical protein
MEVNCRGICEGQSREGFLTMKGFRCYLLGRRRPRMIISGPSPLFLTGFPRPLPQSGARLCSG